MDQAAQQLRALPTVAQEKLRAQVIDLASLDCDKYALDGRRVFQRLELPRDDDKLVATVARLLKDLAPPSSDKR